MLSPFSLERHTYVKHSATYVKYSATVFYYPKRRETFKRNIPGGIRGRTWTLRLVARPSLRQSLGARLRLSRTQGPVSLAWRVVAQPLSRLDAATTSLATAAPRSPLAPAAVHCNHTLTSRVLAEKLIVSRLCIVSLNRNYAEKTVW